MTKQRRSTERRGGKRGKDWTEYEDVSRYMLQQLRKRFGLIEVQGKQKLRGQQSKTDWEIDAKGVREIDGSSVIVECRLYRNRRLTQEALAAVAYRISDTGAKGGITVSPLPLQKGAKAVARANQIVHIQLRPESTSASWMAEIDKVTHVGITDTLRATDTATVTVVNSAGNLKE